MSLGHPNKFGDELKRLELHRKPDAIELVWVSDSGQPYVTDVSREEIEEVGVLPALRSARRLLRHTAAMYESDFGSPQ